MTPNRKDVAEFFRLGLQYQLIRINDVVDWADSIIADDDEPPGWAIELAFANHQNAEDLLRNVAGLSQDGLPIQMLLGLTHRLWAERRITVETVRNIGWSLIAHDENQSQPNWGSVLEIYCEEIENGWRTLAEIHRLIDESLGQYAGFVALLPPSCLTD